MTDVVAPLIAVIRFPGSNDEHDAALALELLGAAPRLVWHADETLPLGTAGVVLPGGFSYGDYLRCGAIARFAPVMDAVARFVEEGGPVLGICNGFQILCEAGLLPGVLRQNHHLEFVCADATVRIERCDNPWFAACEVGETLMIPVKHGEGAWYADDDLVSALEAQGQLALRYVDDVNGATGKVAGVVNDRGNVLGLMPHPEHAVDPLLGPTGGRPILTALVESARAHVGAVVA